MKTKYANLDGTFKLTDEPTGEPPERMRRWFHGAGHARDGLWVLDVGETRALDG